MSKKIYNEETGEIVELPKFYGMWNGHERLGQDLSRETEDVYEEIPPFTKNEKGEWLNDTSMPKLVKTGEVNIQEKIQSFLDDVDIYKILEKMARADDYSALQASNSGDIDVSNIPTNINEFHEFLENNMANMPSEIVAVLSNPSHTVSDINAAINSYNQRVRSSKIEKKEESKEEKKDEKKEVEK